MPGVVRSFAASSPLVVRNLALRAVVVGSAAVAVRIGAADLAAHQVAFTIWTTLALGLDAVAIAGQALVGRYLGASDVEGARGATRRMIELSILFGAVLGVAIFASRHLLPLLFTNDPEVRDLLAAVLVIIAVMQPVAGIVFALDGVLIGAGDLRYLAIAQASDCARLRSSRRHRARPRFGSRGAVVGDRRLGHRPPRGAGLSAAQRCLGRRRRYEVRRLWQLAVGSWQLAVGSWQLAVGSKEDRACSEGLVFRVRCVRPSP